LGDQSLPTESHDPRVDAALQDYLERFDQGETLDPASFVAEHPEIAAELRSLIDAEVQLRKLAARDAQSSGNSTRSFALHGQETIAPQARANRPGEAKDRRLNEQFGRYRILKLLGQGAMGTVYLAEDSQLKRQVALKTPHFDKDPTGELLERLYREARAAATLRHPNICPVHDVGEINGTHYISMAYIEGHPLSAFIRASKPQPERQILIVVRKLAQALQEAHDHKIVHRDLKPANIMVDKRGEPLIMDFGLARHTRADDDVRLTHSGTLVGTPAYMSPEQVDGNSEKIGPLTDEYSLGVILYELLTSQLPFRGSMMAVLGQIVTKEAPAPSQIRAGLDPRIDAACLKMMAKNPSDRFPSLSAVAEALATILRSPAARPAATGKSMAGFTLPSAEGPAASGAATSQILKSQGQKSLTASDLESLEELARKCWSRHDYDQVIQIVERIPEDKRSANLQTLLEKAREKTDEIAFLLVAIDEAVRLEDRQTALKKAEVLLKIKPGHHRGLEVQEHFSGEGGGGAVRIGPKTLAKAWSEGGWIPWSALAFGAAVVGIVAGVIIWWVNGTAVIIDAKDRGITVDINGKQAIINVPGKQKITVEPGDGQISVSYEGLETQTKKFQIKKGESKILTVAIVDNKLVAQFAGEILPLISDGEKAKNIGNLPAETQEPSPVARAAPRSAASAGRSDDGFVPLFNGKDKVGWKIHPSQPGNWRVEKGILIGSGTEKSQPYISERSHLYTERGDFKDFHLRVEARINDGGNSGLYFRSTVGPARPTDDPKFPYGYEAQIDSSVDPARTGSLYAGGTVVVGVSDTLVPPGQWFTEEVIAQGNRFTIKVNGQTTAIYRDEKEISASGHIALQQNNPKTIVEFRKIEIKELSVDGLAEVPVVSADGYLSLFNGKSLSGWSADPSQQGAWHLENGLLVGGGPAGASFLYSDRADYKNFRLRIEARLKGDAYSGLWVRTEVPPGNAVSRTPTSGYKVELREPADRRTSRTGTIRAATKGPEGGPSYSGFAPNEPMVEPGRWFTLEVVAEGKRVWVLVNGERAAATNWFKRDQYSSGRIALQQHVGKPSIEIRKIEIKELADSSASPVAGGPKTGAPPMDKDALIAPFEEPDAKAGQQKWANRLGKTVNWTNTIQMQFQLIPPGQFTMGKGESGRDGPAHTVRIMRPFYFGTYEVTRGQFAKFVAGDSQFKTRAERDKGGHRLENIDKRTKWDGKHQYTWKKPGFPQENSHPVVDVTWDDAREFCEWLSRTEGKTYRLPTEAEWEYAARAGTTAGHYGGDRAQDLTQIANYPDASTKSRFPEWHPLETSDGFIFTSPVGQFRPNNFGLYDTLGNVLEWCADWNDNDYYRTSPQDDPPGPSAGRHRIARGGSFASLSDVSGRWTMTQNHHVPDLGFRVVCEIPKAPEPVEPASAGGTPAASDSRHVWIGHSRFDNVAVGKWRETFPHDPGHAIYSFDEVARKPDYVEIIDKTRLKTKGGVSVRLEEKQALMRWGGPDKQFNLLQSGQWVMAEPPAAEAAPPAASVAPAPADTRRVWLGKTQFENIAPGQWRETFPHDPPGHNPISYAEVARTPEYVELIDRVRSKEGVRIRLEDNQALILWPGRNKDFTRFKRGHWIASTEPPATAASPPNGNRSSFFNGRDLDGWRGLPGFWHVKDQAIVGSVPTSGKSAHTFLCSQREYKNFELKFRARLLGGVGNSGVNFRSKIKDAQKFTVVGPQCEICGDDGKRVYPTGSLVSEPHGKPDVVPPADQVARIFKEADFNDFEIRCVGQHARIKLNGQTTVDADFPSMPDAGVIAWQMHGSRPPKEVTFKDIEFTDLSVP
jgi:serine/threonine protein kinase/formylglycine-generating enzyme required for sulfatase activity